MCAGSILMGQYIDFNILSVGMNENVLLLTLSRAIIRTLQYQVYQLRKNVFQCELAGSKESS